MAINDMSSDDILSQSSGSVKRRHRAAWSARGRVTFDEWLFLPFADSLAGTETYGAGRYLELEPAGKGRLLVDFNRACNPYCAYNETWSCPITSAENRLKVPIRAGEKVFHE
jgi:uncharacterized protein